MLMMLPPCLWWIDVDDVTAMFVVDVDDVTAMFVVDCC